MSYFTYDSGDEGTNYKKEISNMMHGFGDNRKPNAATVVLVENIVLQQLRMMIQEASTNSVSRGAKAITNFDIIYLMRKNPLKLKRLYDYQEKLDLIDSSRKRCSLTENKEPDVILEEDDKDDKDPPIKTKRSHIDVIKELDETDEVSFIKFDTIQYLRKVRAGKITESMSFKRYQAYHKARCSSFQSGPGSRKGFGKLEKWVNPTKELKIHHTALEVLCFLAYETVAEIVDNVFLIRQDRMKKNGDPFSKFEGGYFCNPQMLNNAMSVKTGYEGVPAITVAEVREVLRRHYTPTNGLRGRFYRSMSLDLPSRYIAI